MRFHLKTATALFLLAMKATPSVSQLPITQLYCFDMERGTAGTNVKNARFLTEFNPRGYNNQPQWVSNTEVYLSVQSPADTTQTDIISLSLLANTITRVTATPESEYSPTVMPDRRSFSCVRADIPSHGGLQRLWAYPYDRSNSGRDLLPSQQNIGYHCWLSDKKVALFIVDGQQNHLKIANIDDQSSVQLMGGIGRSLVRMGDGKLAYVQKATAQTWYIMMLDPNSYSSSIFIETLPGSEDFTVTSDGIFIMGHGGKLYAYNPINQDKQWREIADLSRFGLTNIKRVSVNRDMDKIVIVNDIPRK